MGGALAVEIGIYLLILTFLCQVYIYIYLHLEHCAIVGLIIKLRTNGYFCDEVIVMLSSV